MAFSSHEIDSDDKHGPSPYPGDAGEWYGTPTPNASVANPTRVSLAGLLRVLVAFVPPVTLGFMGGQYGAETLPGAFCL